MRYSSLILPLALLFSILSGCNSHETQTTVEADGNKEIVAAEEEEEEEEEILAGSNENIEENENMKKDLANKLKNYETIVLEDLKENHEILVKYPKFNYGPLDEIISVEYNEIFKGEIEQARIYSLDEHYEDVRYFYNLTFDKPHITKKHVSIYFEGQFYQGGGHSFSKTLNFDLEDELLITLEGVLNEHSTSLEVMADLVSQKLIKDEEFAEHRPDPVTEQYKSDVMEETKPIESNYSSFTLTDDSIIFHKQYYSIFPNVAGIVGVEITWDEVDKYKGMEEKSVRNTESVNYVFGDIVEPELTLGYVDEDYGFSLSVPQSWKGNYLIREISVKENNHAAVNPSKVLAFSMVEDGIYIGDVFYIEVLEGLSEEEAKEIYEYGDFGGFVAAENGVALGYGWIGNMPEPLYEEPYLETGNRFARMAQDDRTVILQTVKFQ